MTRVTFDTNILPVQDVVTAAHGLNCDFAVVTVTEREVQGSSYEVGLKSLDKVKETGVYGESRWGQAVYGSSRSSETLDQILDIISSGSFPSNKSNLSDGQRSQLRDAMILEAHVRAGRNVFVTNDRKAFVRNGRRDLLNAKFDTRILTKQEFLTACKARRI